MAATAKESAPAVEVGEATEGDADNLLDRILMNALGGGGGQANVKSEGPDGVKKEVKTEGGVKVEVKGEQGVKSEPHVKRELVEAPALPDIGDDDKKALARKRSRSRGKKRSKSRGRKKRSRSRKRRKSSSSSPSKSPVQAALDSLPQARVVAIRGHWAQYLSPAGETFYKNVLNGEVQWGKPGNFDCQPSRRAGEMTPAPGEAACYIFHMPPEWSEADLMQLFAPFGQVTNAHVQRDANGFSRSSGFVTYASTDSANQACNMMNGFGVDGKWLKVSLTQFALGAGGPGAPGGALGGGGGPGGPGAIGGGGGGAMGGMPSLPGLPGLPGI